MEMSRVTGEADLYAFLDRPARELAETDLFLLSAMRGWVAAARRGRCACGALVRGFDERGVAEALGEFATAMALLDRHGRGKLSFAPVLGPEVTDDEARLLALFALGRGGEARAVESAAAGLVCPNAAARLIRAVGAVGLALMGDAA